jgi:hypothetical protein
MRSHHDASVLTDKSLSEASRPQATRDMPGKAKMALPGPFRLRMGFDKGQLEAFPARAISDRFAAQSTAAQSVATGSLTVTVIRCQCGHGYE